LANPLKATLSEDPVDLVNVNVPVKLPVDPSKDGANRITTDAVPPPAIVSAAELTKVKLADMYGVIVMDVNPLLVIVTVLVVAETCPITVESNIRDVADTFILSITVHRNSTVLVVGVVSPKIGGIDVLVKVINPFFAPPVASDGASYAAVIVEEPATKPTAAGTVNVKGDVTENPSPVTLVISMATGVVPRFLITVEFADIILIRLVVLRLYYRT